MVATRFAKCPPDEELLAGFRRVRNDLEIPAKFAEAAEEEAAMVATRGPLLPPGVPDLKRTDHRGIDFVAIDPPGSRDIDQAFAATRTKHGYLVHYAIADLGAFVIPGGAIDIEAQERGATMYSPDSRASLHPEDLNHGIASLLPGVDRAALVWSLKLNQDGSLHAATVERSVVRNRQAITYREAAEALTHPNPAENLILLREVGRLRQELERRRHAVNLRLPAQNIQSSEGSYKLEFDETLPIEGWNAQISLLTGMAAADLMLAAGIGILRTLPKPWTETVAELRTIAHGLHVGWDQQVGYAERIRELDPAIPAEAALLSASARGLRGAGYLPFTNGETPNHPEHSAIAANYAHVTAPLRRLVDRFTNEIVLAICGDYPVPDWVHETMVELPAIMGRAKNRESQLERGLLNFMEAATLRGRVGDEFEGVVSSRKDGHATIMITEPAIIATIDDPSLELGDHVVVRVTRVDVNESQVVFETIPQD